jgi:AcrR family transcriptional regulator
MANNKNTQEVLLKAAVDLFYKKGYAGTSIRDVGVKAGVSNSLLYHYFKDKEEMLFEIIQAFSKEITDELAQIEKSVPDPVERLRQMLTHHIKHGIKNRKKTRLIVEELLSLTGKRREKVHEFERELYAFYMKTLKEIAASGRIRDNLDLTVVNFALFAPINWFFKWYKEGDRLTVEEVADNTLAVLFHGILKDEKENMKGG